MLCSSVAVTEALRATEQSKSISAVSHSSSGIAFHQNRGPCCFFVKIVGRTLKTKRKIKSVQERNNSKALQTIEKLIQNTKY